MPFSPGSLHGNLGWAPLRHHRRRQSRALDISAQATSEPVICGTRPLRSRIAKAIPSRPPSKRTYLAGSCQHSWSVPRSLVSKHTECAPATPSKFFCVA
jgi:hypothetical protein